MVTDYLKTELNTIWHNAQVNSADMVREISEFLGWNTPDWWVMPTLSALIIISVCALVWSVKGMYQDTEAHFENAPGPKLKLVQSDTSYIRYLPDTNATELRTPRDTNMWVTPKMPDQIVQFGFDAGGNLSAIRFGFDARNIDGVKEIHHLSSRVKRAEETVDIYAKLRGQ